MKYQKCGDGDYLLMKEEYLRESLPSDLGIALNKESGRREPAIVLRQPLKNKEDLKFRDVESLWAVAHNSGQVEMMFLTINFKTADGKHPEQIRICINGFTSHLMEWFRLLIDTEGELALSDTTGDVQAIMVTGVPLDLPRAILAQTQAAL
jgi:hypothetical protein